MTRLVTPLDQEKRVRSIMVVDAPIVNAVTLPGGRIILFHGLLAQLHSPDALAGIVGHEIGHIQHRDGIAALIRQFGLKSALGGLNGEGSSYAQAMIGLSYSRDAERAADDQSIEILKRAQINPLITARFFDEALKKPTMLGEAWLSTHPLSKVRSRRYAGSLNRSTFYRRALSEEDWSALQSICMSSQR